MDLQEAIESYARQNNEASPAEIIREAIKICYPPSPIVLDAINYFITIAKRKDFCVEQDKLAKYGILSIRYERNHINSTDVKRMLNQYNDLIENIDYINRRNSASNNGRTKYNIQYTLTPKAFYLCLTRSKNSSKYACYYFHVYQSLEYYSDYHKKVVIQNKDSMIETLLIKLDRNSEESKKHLEESKMLRDKLDRNSEESKKHLEENKMLRDKLDRQSEENTKQFEENKSIKIQMTEMQITLNKIAAKLDNNVEYPSNDKLTERFVIMINGDINTVPLRCHVIRAQERNIRRSIKKKEGDGYSKLDGIIESEIIPNSVCLWSVIKEVLSEEKRISNARYNDFELKMSKDDLVSIIRSVFDRRRLIE